MTDGEAQAAVAAVALELVAIADRLQSIHDELSQSPDREAMLEHRIPRDVATEVYGVVESVLVDEVRPAVEHLEWAARVTAEELGVRWEKDRAIWERFRGRL
jgi:hypothetical protein